jgi:hypothetical protein
MKYDFEKPSPSAEASLGVPWLCARMVTSGGLLPFDSQVRIQCKYSFVAFCSIIYSHLETKSHGIENILALGRPGSEPCPAILVANFKQPLCSN